MEDNLGNTPQTQITTNESLSDLSGELCRTHSAQDYKFIGYCTFYHQKKSKMWQCKKCKQIIFLPRKSYDVIKGIVYPRLWVSV